MSSFQMDPNYERELEAVIAPAAQRMVQNLRRVLEDFHTQYAGQDVSVVKPALERAWAGSNEGANISDPELTTCAQKVSEGKRIWIDDNGHIKAQD